MSNYISLFLCFFMLSFGIHQSYAQEVKKSVDSVKAYKDLEKFSKKSKLGKFFHGLIFKSTDRKKTSETIQNIRIETKNKLAQKNGKIIRTIFIETLDPFGYSAENKLDYPTRRYETFGNDLHIKTKNWTVRNLLLFKKNEPLDTVLIYETERLIRSQRYARSVLISPVNLKNSTDSIDVVVRVLDSWSLIPTGALSSSRGNFELTERNFFGLGHSLTGDFGKRFSDGSSSKTASYTVNNIKNSYINTQFFYNESFTKNETKRVSVSRAFFSPLTHWAGGVLYEFKKQNDSLPNSMNQFIDVKINNQVKDFWLGYAFKIDSDKLFTRWVTGLSYRKVNFFNAPNLSLDPSNYFSDETTYLASMGLSTRKYYQDRFLFNYDIVEDIPTGSLYSLTTGVRKKNNATQNYYGTKASFGKKYSFGYLNSTVELGSFFENNQSFETTFRLEASYFTNLLSLGAIRFRQFVQPSVVIGNNRDSSIKDRLTLNENSGFEAFNNPRVNGTKRATLVLQTQTYLPGNWMSFHFSPFVNMTFSTLGNTTQELFDNRLYSKFTLGVLISNDYLVFNNFQLSFTFYPTIPFVGDNLVRSNTLKNNDFRIPDYDLNEPSVVSYQ